MYRDSKRVCGGGVCMCVCACVCNAIAFLTLAQSLTTTKTTQIATKNGKSPVEKSEKKEQQSKQAVKK